MANREIFDLVNDIDSALENLAFLPDMIQLTIESLNLDERTLTEDQQMDLIIRHEQLHSVLCMTQNIIEETVTKVNDIGSAAVKKGEDTDEPAAS